MLEVKNLQVQRGEKFLLKNINFSFSYGDFVAVLGPNGAGKSTLMQYLSGIEKNYQGEIFLENINLKNFSLKELAKKRACLSQNYQVNFPFKIEEIIAMGLENYSEKIINELLFLLDILHLKNRNFSNLSGGEKQRVQIARILAQIYEKENVFLFLDEPISSLDLKHQFLLLKLLKNLAQNKVGILIIIHDLALAASFANKFLLLKNGEIFCFENKEKALTKNNLINLFEVKDEAGKNYLKKLLA
jgi:iron complex transport system ATP-binding protein